MGDTSTVHLVYFNQFITFGGPPCTYGAPMGIVTCFVVPGICWVNTIGESTTVLYIFFWNGTRTLILVTNRFLFRLYYCSILTCNNSSFPYGWPVLRQVQFKKRGPSFQLGTEKLRNRTKNSNLTLRDNKIP